MPTVYVGVIAALVLSVATAIVFYRLLAAPRAASAPAEFLDTFSTERYRPMLRLLDDDEFAFLAAQPGFRKEIGRRFRRERIRIFRSYLTRLQRDFHKLHAAARVAVTYASEDGAELASILLRQRWTFLWVCAAVQFRLCLYQAGLTTMDLRGMVDLVEAMRCQLAAAAQPPRPHSVAAIR